MIRRSSKRIAAMQQISPSLKVKKVESIYNDGQNFNQIIPAEIKYSIFEYLEREDLQAANAVCKLWNQMITNNNKLMDKMNLMEIPDEENPTEFASQFTRRNVNFHVNIGKLPADNEYSEKYERIRHRISSIRIQVKIIEFCSEKFKELLDSFPNLSQLDIVRKETYLNVEKISDINVSSRNSPPQRFVVPPYHHVMSSIPALPLQLMKVKSFRIYDKSASTFLSQALNSMPSNILKSFEFTHLDVSQIVFKRNIHEAKLQEFLKNQKNITSLKLKNLFAIEMFNLENIMIIPCVINCKILDFGFIHENNIHILFENVVKMPQLEELSFDCCSYDKEIPILESCLNLRRLTLGDQISKSVDKDFLSKIVCNQVSLEVLTLNFPQNDHPDWKILGNQMKLRVLKCTKFSMSALSQLKNSSIEYLVIIRESKTTRSFIENDNDWKRFRDRNPKFKSISFENVWKILVVVSVCSYFVILM